MSDKAREDAALQLPIKIDESVGTRWGNIPQRNRVRDQERLLTAFAAVPAEHFGNLPIEIDGRVHQITDRVCLPHLQKSISAFQKKQALGTDQVVDPAGNVIKRLNQILGALPPPPAKKPKIPPRDQWFPKPSKPPAPGICSITNINNATVTLGVGAGGFFAVEIVAPGGQKVRFAGVGGGGALGLDPSKFLKLFKKDGLASFLADGLAKGSKFLANKEVLTRLLGEALASYALTLADWLTLFGVSLPPAATGLLFASRIDMQPITKRQTDLLKEIVGLIKTPLPVIDFFEDAGDSLRYAERPAGNGAE